MNTLPAISFRFKILFLIVLILVGAIGATLYVTQQQVEETYQTLFEREYETQLEFFTGRLRDRLSSANTLIAELAANPQFVAALRAEDSDKLRELLGNYFRSGPPNRDRSITPREMVSRPSHGGGRTPIDPETYVRVYNIDGNEIAAAGRAQRARRLPKRTLDYYKQLAAEAKQQQLGFFRAAAEEGPDYLASVVITPVLQSGDDELVGLILMGSQVQGFGGSIQRASSVQSGIILEGDIFTRAIPGTLATTIIDAVERERTKAGDGDISFTFDLELNGIPYRCFVRALNPGSVFPVALNVTLFSLADQDLDIRELRLMVLAIGCVVFVVGSLLAWLMSQRLSVPLNELVVATKEIEKGNYQHSVRVRGRDEVGQLASSFNQMAEGLAQKEKFQSVLNQVADRDVAEALLAGELALGGVSLPVTVLFCDIRGFSAMSESLEPTEVVRLLNKHMTAMTQVAHEHHGVVDKFVGDMIMVVFGAPKSYGDDVGNAVRCALKMIEVRQSLNATANTPLEIGIGVATGDVLAGCMGSEDRLNYTVLGAEVNLGSRLSDFAGGMEVLVDSATRSALGDSAEVEERSAIRLKGFSEPVNCYKVIRFRGS